MRHRSTLIVAGLLGLALFIIANCAGYLLVSLLGRPAGGSFLAGSMTNGQPALATPVNVVTFSAPPPTAQANAPSTTPESPRPLLPTVTPGPTSTPAAPPTVAASPVEPEPANPASLTEPLRIVSHKSYVDSLGWYHIVGEVENLSDAPMEFVEVIAKLYDEQEEVIGTKLTFTAPDLIFPGGKAPFDLIAMRQAQWGEIETYRLQVKGHPAENLLPQNLVLLSQAVRFQNGYMYIEGQVQNTGSAETLVKLIVTLYDSDQNIVNTTWSYADAGVIPAEGDSPFSVRIDPPDDPDNYHYRIQIEEEPLNTTEALPDKTN